VFLLDDGFQHLQLARDVNILLIDAAQPLARQTMLPTGRLREPLSAMVRADLLVFTRAETVPGTGSKHSKKCWRGTDPRYTKRLSAHRRSAPFFHALHARFLTFSRIRS